MQKIILSFSALLCSFSTFSQNDIVSLSQGYSTQSFYSLSNGEALNSPNNNWDIAFHTDIYSATIRINDGQGVELYTYPLGDTSSWNNINNSVTNILTSPMYNSDTSWNYGAFGVNKSSNMMDYGWGSYNIVNHHIVGDSLFIIKTVDGNYKKLWMDRKASGTYYFKFADLDGSNEIIASVPASSYPSKRFIYYSLNQGLIIDREPSLSSWDITFTKYITPVQSIPYSVTGVLSNQGIKVADAQNISSPSTYTNYTGHSFSNEINGIGYNWKTFDMSSFAYFLDNDRCFFIKDYNQNIWRIIFTQFDGSSTGNIGFNLQNISTSSNNNINNQEYSFNIYPNPSGNEDITVIYEINNFDAMLNIYDISGRNVYTSNLKNGGFKTHSIPSYLLEKGVYIVSVEIENKILTERLIVN